MYDAEYIRSRRQLSAVQPKDRGRHCTQVNQEGYRGGEKDRQGHASQARLARRFPEIRRRRLRGLPRTLAAVMKGSHRMFF